jgi:hypothetical protein
MSLEIWQQNLLAVLAGERKENDAIQGSKLFLTINLRRSSAAAKGREEEETS